MRLPHRISALFVVVGSPLPNASNARWRRHDCDLTNPSLIAAMTALARLWAPSLE